MHRVLLVSLLLIVLFSAGPRLQADEGRPHFAIINWFPFGTVQNGVKKGLFVDVARAVADVSDMNAEIMVVPLPRVFRGMQEGIFDFTFTYKSKDLQDKLRYIADIGCLRPAIISMKGSPVTSLAQLNGRRVAHPPVGDFVRRVLPTLNVEGVVAQRTDVMFKMALYGRVDAFVINEAIWHAYKRDAYSEFKVPAERWKEFYEPLYMKPMRLSLSISRGSKYQALASRMTDLLETPGFRKELQVIFDRYGLNNATACLPGAALYGS